MRLIRSLPLMIAASMALGACSFDYSPPQPATQIVVQSPPSAEPIAPMPPPAPLAEVVPPPPASNTRTVWQPGHWRYTGLANKPWNWQSGQYVAVPSGAAAWTPGVWQHQGDGWVWHQGHWA